MLKLIILRTRPYILEVATDLNVHYGDYGLEFERMTNVVSLALFEGY